MLFMLVLFGVMIDRVPLDRILGIRSFDLNNALSVDQSFSSVYCGSHCTDCSFAIIFALL